MKLGGEGKQGAIVGNYRKKKNRNRKKKLKKYLVDVRVWEL